MKKRHVKIHLIICGGTIDRWYPATHGANIHRELPAMMDGIEEAEPEHVSHAGFKEYPAIDHKLCWFLMPASVVHCP